MWHLDWHAVDPLLTSLFGAGCFVVGGAMTTMGHWLWRKRRRPDVPYTTEPDPELDAMYAFRARDWAQQRGTPHLAHHAYRSLRLMDRLSREREERYGHR